MGRGFFQSMVTQGQGTSSGLRVPIRRETLARPPRAPRGRGYRSSVIRRSQQFASSADTSSGRDSGGGDYVSSGDHSERDRKSTRLNSSHVAISYAVFCLKKKKKMSISYPA